jgi:zinc and cadmium transporter
MGSHWFWNSFSFPLTLGIASVSHSVPTGAFTSGTLILLTIYCGLIAVSSLCGGVLPLMIRLTHTRMQVLVSVVGGFMLGVGIFHQLPHAIIVMTTGGKDPSFSIDWCMNWLMFGLLLTFFMLRMFHFHSHGPTEEDGPHGHDCAHDHDHDHHTSSGAGPTLNGSSWIGIFLGLSLHTLLDGVALAANVQADALHDHPHGLIFGLLGVGTFLGVALHKPLDSLSITSLMAAEGWSPQVMKLVNLGYALMCPLGAFLFYFGIQKYAGAQSTIVAAALAMSAGVFICISLSDLLPEVQFHSHDRVKLSAALLLGIGAAWVIGLLEPARTHGHHHDHQHPAAAADREPKPQNI